MSTVDAVSHGFAYEPLDLEIDSLRILHLEPRGNGVRGSLENRTFVSKPVYETLSYTWGPETACENILLNGYEYPVRKNLYNALIHLQRDTPRAIWVDAICIDQENISERNYQVDLMSFIYSRSTIVLVWLNVSVKKLAEQHLDDPPQTRLQEILFTEENRHAVANLPYWTRAWVVQEYVLPKEVNFLLDEFVLSDQEFYDQTRDIDQRPFRKRIEALREHRQRHQTESFRLEKLIRTFESSNCTETRDKLFAFLGLAHDNELDADYEMSYVELFTKLIHFHQDSEAELEDWRTADVYDRAAKLMHFSELIQNCLRGEVEREIQQGSQFLDNTRVFTAKGATVSRVLYIGPSYDEVLSSMHAEREWRHARQLHYGQYDKLPDFLTADKKFTRSLLEWGDDRVKTMRRVRASESHAYRLEPYNDSLAIRTSYADVQSDASAPKRFLGTRGCFGMAPSEARVGDVLAAFLDCDSYVVLRPVAKDCWTIVGKARGAAVMTRGQPEFHVVEAVRDELRNWSRSVLEEGKWDKGEGYFDGTRNVINLQLDVQTLQQLTA